MNNPKAVHDYEVYASNVFLTNLIACENFDPTMEFKFY